MFVITLNFTEIMGIKFIVPKCFPLGNYGFPCNLTVQNRIAHIYNRFKMIQNDLNGGKERERDRVENSGGRNNTRQYTATLFTVNILAKLKIKVHIYLHQNVTFIFRFQVMQQFSLNKIFSVCTLPHLSFFCCICICICKMLYRVGVCVFV